MPRVGELIAGKYRLTGLLGEGGMGSVYEAVHDEIGKTVAIKFVCDDAENSLENIQRFKREARAAAAVGHEAIVNVFDIGATEDGIQFLVMEYLPGKSLGERIELVGALSIPLTAYIGCQVLSGLSAAHEARIVHRDLKPDNIFLVETGAAMPGVKILDFGISIIAATVNPGQKNPRLTRAGMVMGTPQYMSPEQARGVRDVDHRTDLYSLGAILYECLTGRLPFEAESPNQMMYHILTQEPVSPRTYRPHLPNRLEELTMWAMAKNREERPQTCWELFDALVLFVEESAAGRIPLPAGENPNEAATHPFDLKLLGETVERSESPLPAIATIPIGEEELVFVTGDPKKPSVMRGSLEDLEVASSGDTSKPSAQASSETAPQSSPVPVNDEVTDSVSQEAATHVDRVERDFSSNAPTIVRPMEFAELKKQRGSMTTRLLVIGAVVGGLLFGSTVGVLWFNRDARSVDPPPPPPALIVEPNPRTSAQPPEGPQARPSVPESVNVDIQGLPTDARIFLDDAYVESLPITVARGGNAFDLRIECEGYSPYNRVIDPDRDQVITVDLAPRP